MRRIEHECPDWDFMLIRPSDPEMESCVCKETTVRRIDEIEAYLEEAKRLYSPLVRHCGWLVARVRRLEATMVCWDDGCCHISLEEALREDE